MVGATPPFKKGKHMYTVYLIVRRTLKLRFAAKYHDCYLTTEFMIQRRKVYEQAVLRNSQQKPVLVDSFIDNVQATNTLYRYNSNPDTQVNLLYKDANGNAEYECYYYTLVTCHANPINVLNHD